MSGRPLVIGVAGGIGAGKTAVARALASRGCVVIDSDAEAKALLDTEGVRGRLVEWWGEGVLGADGRVDRGALARIIFSDADERKRLEGLVHPLVGARRRERIEEAARGGVEAVVVDAPLLFEAGVDRECDVVVFVDAPGVERAARVREERGWGVEELSRRESAQMPLEEKRARSDFVVMNTGSEADLEKWAGEFLRGLLRERSRAGRGGRGGSGGGSAPGAGGEKSGG